jgi:hypothetical protein
MRDLDQPRTALQIAQQVRLTRSRLLLDLENGDAAIADVLADPAVQRATILTVIERCEFPGHQRRGRRTAGGGMPSLPRRHTVQARELLTRVPVSETRLVEQLTERQVTVIVDLVTRSCL